MRGWIRQSLNKSIVFLSVFLAGCSTFLPGFEGPLGIHSWIHNMPVKEAVLQVQCELAYYFYDPAYRDMLQTEQTDGKDPVAKVSLWLQTDTMGNVTYVGIDLNKIGLPALAELISTSNKLPSLQASAQAKTTIKSQVDVDIPQNPRKANVAPCAGAVAPGLVTSLALKSFLDEFSKQYAASLQQNRTACMRTLTLQTQFAFILDVKGGVNPLVGSAFILPVSGINGELQGTYTHSLQIALKLNEKKPACKNLPAPQPTQRI